MHPERWQSCFEIVKAAAEHPLEERAAFVDRSCEGDDRLRRKVELLLQYHDKLGDFIESPAFAAAPELLTNESASALVGESIGHYRVESLLGSGGMGEVYLARDERLERKVALKLLPQTLVADEAHLERLKHEARTASALNQPNIVTIHEIGQVDSTCYIATEFIDGTTLRERIAHGTTAPREAVEIALQIADALSAAHAAGIVHRDIKPENVMLRPDGYVKVLDFGIAKFTQQEPQTGLARLQVSTQPGTILGTTRYMSPEQARGLAVDARTDIWSLGVTLYEMLTGRVPFEGETTSDLIAAVLQREPPPLERARPGLPPQLEDVLRRMLAKECDARFQTAAEVRGELQALQRQLEVSGAPGKRPFVANKTWQLRAVAVAALVLVTIGAVTFFAGWPAAPRSQVQSLGVLPLDNLSGDAAQEYFADGMTDALITDLAKIEALRVISRASVMQYKGARKPLPEIGRELNVDAVLTGSVARAGERVRISVRLTQAATERHLWAESYERDLRDVLTLQKEVARDIVSEISIKLTPPERSQIANARTVNPEAYDEFLRGQFHLYRQHKESNDAAIAALERAVATDSTFAEGFAALAQAYVWKLFLFAPDEKQLSEKAFVAAEKALALDPELATAHLARGRLLWTPANRFPHEKAIRAYRRALELNPNLDEARNQLALVYNHVGALDEALEELRKAVAINPSNSLADFRIGETYLFQGAYTEALEHLRRVPDDVNPALVGHQIAWALFNLGRKEEAAATVEQCLERFPDDNRGLFTSVEAVLAASNGNEAVAEEKIKSAVERGKGLGHFHHTAYYIACAYALLNKPEQAISWLEAAAEEGFPCYPLFASDGNFANVRQHPRFVAFVAKLRQQWEYYRSIL